MLIAGEDRNSNIRSLEMRNENTAIRSIWYSQIKSINNPLLPNFGEERQNEDNGEGFGCKDVTDFKFGLAFDATERVRLFGGYNYGA